jgi:hypothetical protein
MECKAVEYLNVIPADAVLISSDEVPDNVWNAAYDQIVADFASDEMVDVEYYVLEGAYGPEYYTCAYSEVSDAAICYFFPDCVEVKEPYSKAATVTILLVGLGIAGTLVYFASRA